ncbi:MAG TPA: beta-L-arabinofuranosidase domain-containing protein, partial [Opitutaceae bacterium]|nr:beta-L-arabinofuranosidase domain-containing protein [Opitutaceae bacterium]
MKPKLEQTPEEDRAIAPPKPHGRLAAAFAALLVAGFPAALRSDGAVADTAAGRPAGYGVEPQLRLLRFGEVMPKGWIREQMIRDLQVGFAGHMPEIAPFTCGADIFGANRNLPDRIQNAGGGSWGGAEGAWWKGETEGNWKSGNIMQSLLTGLPEFRAKADAKAAALLATQDADGYMGIYGPTLRWAAGNIDNGELWTQTCILRGLIAYYEATGKAEVLRAVERSAKLTMGHYGEANDPYGPGTQNHNLMYVDVMERLYELTGNTAYRDFGVYLYRDYSRDVKTDVSLTVLLAQDHPFVGHGATTYEGLRVPIWAAYATGDPVLLAAGEQALAKSWPHVSPTGGPVSDEFIENKPTDPDKVGYEGCGEKEWMTSLLSAAQKTGRAALADRAETTFYNSVQGSRLSDGTAVDYVTKDNLYRIEGALMNRCLFSPAHEDVANCCAPNLTQIGPIFVRNMWMRAPDGLAMVLFGPCEVRTSVGNVGVRLAEETDYPFSELIQVRVDPDAPVDFVLHVRVPPWATGVDAKCPGADTHRAGDWLLVAKRWQAGDTVSLSFGAAVQPVPANNGEFYLRRGPLFYALG